MTQTAEQRAAALVALHDEIASEHAEGNTETATAVVDALRAYLEERLVKSLGDETADFVALNARAVAALKPPEPKTS